jgi:acetoacetate decarboxylase
MSKILIGTASWTDKTLIASGRFYPPKCHTPEEWLGDTRNVTMFFDKTGEFWTVLNPKISHEGEVTVGTLHYGQALCALGTFGYKHRAAAKDAVLKSLRQPNFLLKVIPHVDGTPRICELVRYHLEDIALKEAWNTPAELQLFGHVIADVARLPVLEIVSGQHLVADLTLGLGEVDFDYLAENTARAAARHPKPQREPANVYG